MVRFVSAVLLALILGWSALPAAADLDAEERTLTQDIETRGLTGDALALAHLARGTLRLLGGQTSTALADYDQAVALAPKLGIAYLHRSVGRREAGDLPHAIEDASQALVLGVPDEVAAYYLRAELRASLKDYHAAIADYDQAIALDKDFGHAYAARSVARLEIGDAAGALADATYAIKGEPKLYEYKDPFRVIPHYRILFARFQWNPVSSDDGPALAYFVRGRLLLEKGDYKRSRSDLVRATRAVEKIPDVWVYYGLQQLGIHHCGDGEDTLDKAAERLGTTRAALVQAHHDFIAKTPCAEDLLE